jgi:NadR type nicotinamide-nucleotide adenylyltransferase
VTTATTTPHGLVIGKMMPPHDGHVLLVRTAAAVSERVTVLVFAHPDQRLDLDLRVRWLAEAVADLPHVVVAGGVDPHEVDYDDPAVWDRHEDEFRRVLADLGAPPVSAVFSSEPYGAELARRFGAVDVQVDPERALVPISASAVRQDPVGSWAHLPEPVRGGLALRVVLVGAESTGKTTIAGRLTERLQARGGAHGWTRWVPEVGREVTVSMVAEASARSGLTGGAPATVGDLAWETTAFVAIARAQGQREDRLARLGGPVLVCDTDAFATGIWHERYVGHRSADVEALARPHPLYLVPDPVAVPFEQDGVRDGEQIRAWMHGRFIERLAATGRSHVVLSGTLEHRLDRAEAEVDRLLGSGAWWEREWEGLHHG